MTNRQSVTRFADASSFLDRCRDWLFQDEALNSEILSVSQLLSTENSNAYSPPYYFAAIVDQNGINGCAVQALPDAFTISSLPSQNVSPLLVDRLEHGPPIEWLTAPDETALAFGEAWEIEHGGSWSIRYRWLVHLITEVAIPVNTAPGELRRAITADRDLILDAANQYEIEAPAPIDIPQFMERKLSEGNLYVWDNGGLRTIIAISGRTTSSVRISAVYTPDESRGRGYASAAVAALSKNLLDSGLKFCTLTTNAAKPKTAKLYSTLGYQVIGRRTSIALTV